MGKSWNSAMTFGCRDPGRKLCLSGAARNLSKHGVRVCIIGSATSVARFSRSTKFFVNCSWNCRTMSSLNILWTFREASNTRLGSLSHQRRTIARCVTACFAPEKHYVLTTPAWWETVRFLYDKRLTCVLAQEAGVTMPRSYEAENAERLTSLDIDFPVSSNQLPPHFLRESPIGRLSELTIKKNSSDFTRGCRE